MAGKVLFVTSIKTYGGGERWMMDTAAGLARRRHAVLLAARPGSMIAARAAAAGLPCRRVEMRGDFDPLAIASMASIVRSFRPDVVCPNLDKEIRISALALLAAGGRGKRRGVAPVSGASGRARLIPRRGSEFPLKNKAHYRHFYTRLVDRVIVNSRATKNTMLDSVSWFPPWKAVVVYNGIDPGPYERLQHERDRIRRELREALGVGPEEKLIALVGELTERKGHRFIVEAAPMVLSSHPRARFLFVGEGVEREPLGRLIAARALADRFHFLGFREDVPEILVASDLLVLPSRVEGFGYVLIEAMAAGLPVVASRSSSIPEVVEDGVSGLLHPYGDVQAIADCIGRLLADGELAAAMGDAGRERVREKFSLDRMLDEVEALFFGDRPPAGKTTSPSTMNGPR